MTLSIDPVRDALIIVDLQPDFMPGGALPVPGGDDIVEPIARLLTGGPPFGTVVATQDWHPPRHISFASEHEGRAPFDTIELYGHEQVLWPDHCVQGTPGAALHPGLPLEPVSAIIRKGQDPDIDSYSGFRDNHGPRAHLENAERRETGLAGYLRSRGVRRVVVCGLALDVCVAWTARDAVAFGLETQVIGDLSKPVTAEGAERALVELAKAGVSVIESRDILGSS